MEYNGRYREFHELDKNATSIVVVLPNFDSAQIAGDEIQYVCCLPSKEHRQKKIGKYSPPQPIRCVDRTDRGFPHTSNIVQLGAPSVFPNIGGCYLSLLDSQAVAIFVRLLTR